MKINSELEELLSQRMSVTRLAKTGLFIKLDTDGKEEIRKELLLWRAVLDKALLDWFSDCDQIRNSVTDWLNLENQDFIITCERAFLSPEKVLETFKSVKRILRGPNARFPRVENFDKRRIAKSEEDT